MFRPNLGAMWLNLAYIDAMCLGATLPIINYVTYV